MIDVFKQGKAIAIAAHNPVYDGILPDKPGIGIVALASLATSILGKNILIVPVAMDFDQKQLALGGHAGKAAKDLLGGKRTNVTVRIGEPMYLELVDMEKYMEIRSKSAEYVTKDDVQALHKIDEDLRNQGGKVMEQLAELLPAHKRGKWNKRSQ